jgi:hypothetical protein
MQCRELETALSEDDVRPLSPAAREHLAGCPACRDMVADFSAIIITAHSLPAEVNPPDRIWVALRAQLEAEKIIRGDRLVAEPAASWWSAFAPFFRPRALATAAVIALVAAGGVYYREHPASQSKNPQPSFVASTGLSAPAPTAVDRAKPNESAAVSPTHQATAPSPRVVVPPQPHESTTELAPSPSENAYLGDSAAVLSQTESALPARRLTDNAMVDASLRGNLRTLNEFISECETRLKQDPQDQMTREYLNMAYQQKAELLTAMLDSGRSEH